MLFNDIVKKYCAEAHDSAVSKYKLKLDDLYEETNIKRKGLLGEEITTEIFKEYFEDIKKTNLNYELDLISEQYKLRVEVKAFHEKKMLTQEYLKLFRDICNTSEYFHIFINLYPNTLEPHIHHGLKLIYLDISHINNNVMKYIKSIIVKENESNEIMLQKGFKDHVHINYATRNDVINKYIDNINNNVKKNIVEYLKKSNIDAINENIKKLNNFINTSLLKQRRERIRNYEYLLLSNIRPPNYANPNTLNEIVKFIILNYKELTNYNNLMMHNKTTDCIEFTLLSFQNYIYCGYIPNNILRNIKDIFFIHSRNRSIRKNYSLLEYMSPEEYNVKDNSNTSLYRLRTLDEIDNKYIEYKNMLKEYLETKMYKDKEQKQFLDKLAILDYINDVLINNNVIKEEDKITPDIFTINIDDIANKDIFINNEEHTTNDTKVINSDDNKNDKNKDLDNNNDDKELNKDNEDDNTDDFVIEDMETMSSSFFDNLFDDEEANKPIDKPNTKQANIKANAKQTVKPNKVSNITPNDTHKKAVVDESSNEQDNKETTNTIKINKDRIHINDGTITIDHYDLKKSTSKKYHNKYNVEYKGTIQIEKVWLDIAKQYINNNYKALLKPDFTITSDKLKTFAKNEITKHGYKLTYDGSIFKKVLTLYDVYEKRNDSLKPVYRTIYYKFVEDFFNYKEDNNKNNKINKNGVIQGFSSGHVFAVALDEYLNLSNNKLPQRDDKSDLIKYKAFYDKYKLNSTIKRVIEQFIQKLTKNERTDELGAIKAVLMSHGITTSLSNAEKEELFKYHFMKCINENIRFTDEEWLINVNQKTSVYSCVINVYRDIRKRNLDTYTNCRELMEKYKDIAKKNKLCYKFNNKNNICECCYETIK